MLLFEELKRLEWAKELSEDALRAVSNTAEFVEFSPGETVVTLDEGTTSVYFIITGRVHVKVLDTLDQLASQDWLGRGRVLGLFSVAMTDHSHLQAKAVEPTGALRLRLPELLALTCRHTDFQLALIQLAANIARRIYAVDRSLPKPAVVGIVHQSPASRPITIRLVARLAELGESAAVASDEKQWQAGQAIPFRQVIENGKLLGKEERQKQLRKWAAHDRLVIDLGAQHSLQILDQLLSYADIILWCLRPTDVASASRSLESLEEQVPDWRDKIRIVWLLDNESPFPPDARNLRAMAACDFKLALQPPNRNQGSLLYQGLERIVHHLRGIQIGLALGGGAARGMAHLGVLKALEHHGIYVDMVAGTSAGAMTGALYSAGIDPEHAIHCFKADLKLSWVFRHLPAGGYWYLLYKYRRNQFDPMLRKYLSDYRMEQLLIPTFTVAVDLVEGVPVVRATGDATANILESINLPPLALPILRAQEALVDGGLLNNVPADVLVTNGCNFVIASSVTAKLEKDFMGIRSTGRRRAAQFFSTIQVIMRQNMIQSHSMNTVGVQPADLVLAPDVTSFDLSEFTRADEMAVIGENTTNHAAVQLRQMLSKIDPQLFRAE